MIQKMRHCWTMHLQSAINTRISSAVLKSSELYNLNHKTLPQNDGAFTVSSDFADLVSKGLYYSRLSGGGFDITIEPISSMWDFVSDEKIVPDDAALKMRFPLVNYENVTLEGDQIRFAKDGTGLDFRLNCQDISQIR